MEEILTAFGIDWRLILIQMVNFGILAGALWYFLYTPIFTILHTREEKIKKGLDDAVLAQKRLEDAEFTRDELINEARKDSIRMVHDAVVVSERKQQDMLVETEEKIARKHAHAEAEAEALKTQALRESEKEITATALLTAEQILRTELSK